MQFILEANAEKKKRETDALNATCVPLETDETVHLLVLVLICEGLLKPIVLLSLYL